MVDKRGYFFHRRVHPHAPGHPQLDIMFRPVPTLEHFDPELATLTVFDSHANITELQLYHPWNGSTNYQIAPGRIMLRDRKHKVRAAFSFGGILKIASNDNLTHCAMTSDAPILELIEEDPIACLLAAEVASMLAQRRAALERETGKYEHQLAGLDVWQFYLICLCSLKSKFAEIAAHTDGETGAEFMEFLGTELRRLQGTGECPAHLPDLNEIL